MATESVDELIDCIRAIGDEVYELMKQHFDAESPNSELGEYLAQSARKQIIKQQYDKVIEALGKR